MDSRLWLPGELKAYVIHPPGGLLTEPGFQSRNLSGARLVCSGKRLVVDDLSAAADRGDSIVKVFYFDVVCTLIGSTCNLSLFAMGHRKTSPVIDVHNIL